MSKREYHTDTHGEKVDNGVDEKMIKLISSYTVILLLVVVTALVATAFYWLWTVLF